MASMKTPGVWIDEKTALPNPVVEVATAVPAFIGCAASRRIDPPDCVRLTHDKTAQALDIASNQPVTAGSARDDHPGQRHAIVNKRAFWPATVPFLCTRTLPLKGAKAVKLSSEDSRPAEAVSIEKDSPHSPTADV